MSHVHTADLDLDGGGPARRSTTAGNAANEVCGTASDADLAGKNKIRECRADVLAKARAKGERLASSSAIYSRSRQRIIIVEAAEVLVDAALRLPASARLGGSL